MLRQNSTQRRKAAKERKTSDEVSLPMNHPVAQTFLSAGSRDILVPCFGRAKNWRLESRQNPQAGKPALHRGTGAQGAIRVRGGFSSGERASVSTNLSSIRPAENQFVRGMIGRGMEAKQLISVTLIPLTIPGQEEGARFSKPTPRQPPGLFVLHSQNDTAPSRGKTEGVRPRRRVASSRSV